MDIRKNRKKRGRGRRRRLLFLVLGAVLVIAAVFAVRSRKKQSTVPAWIPMEGEYPVSMLEFMEKYPQATDFVMAFPEKKDLHPKIDITEDVRQGGVPLFLQWDERWGYEIYGDDFLGVNGCGPTSLSMVQCGLSGDTKWNPYEVAKMADENGYYVSGVGSSWELMDAGARQMGLQVSEVPFSAEGIVDTLRSGRLIICSMGPGEFTYSGHFVVLTGVDDDGRIFLNDSNSRERSQQTWDADYLLSQAVAMWAYSY
ncbi:hypothetical protein BRYFOR_05071 [Marvinbryantia formatexigens DSM 14469]|uniref:Peptidase C39-like domain-containing protein n=1 Tax=Marvinbryantia formatexigens DSM 14469 TaxID=478749 RepID=C6L8Y2_9FIRM|nr:C39 family peptidase [Marvinbryantia formatexigens]EET62721.1 hypothetical protein BRYFOR_05071 [Marvinbryantia formatexigens DSM 14469]UWO23089.1 C39 family peptidase [Marvinbryantia formatexigens DSM 14469]